MDNRTFHQFQNLHKEIQDTILSYVADAPFEGPMDEYPTSTLTHTLPFVSKAFHAYSLQDEPWFQALLRQLRNEPFLWRQGLEKICRRGERAIDSDGLTDEQLIQLAKEAALVQTYKSVYRLVVSGHLRFKGPVFAMGSPLQLGSPYGLHFFEPRYRLLVREAMQGQPEEARRDGPIHGECLFIHGHMSPLAPTTPAALVQIARCHIFPDGRADVMLVPVAYVWLEKVWTRPNSGGLREAQCLRMDQRASQHMDEKMRSHINMPRILNERDLINILLGHGDDIEDDTTDEEADQLI